MTTVIFVRHGQSTANLERIFAGHTDAPLTELGHKQAENIHSYWNRKQKTEDMRKDICNCRYPQGNTSLKQKARSKI